MNEIMPVSVSTEKDPGLVQTGSTLSSARAICRFLKNFQKKCFAWSCEDMCGIALEIVQLRIALSLETRPPYFQTIELGFRMFNRQLQCKACVARFEAALELGAKMSDALEE